MTRIKASLAAAAMLLAQPGHSAPARDQSWFLLARQLFPGLVAAESSGTAPGAVPSALLERRRRIAACDHVADCVVRASLWSDGEIDAAAGFAERRLTPAQQRAVVPQGDLRAQIGREIRGLNGIVQVYALGSAPRFPAIDGPYDAPGTAAFTARVADSVMLAEGGFHDPVASFDPSIAMALALLDANNRHEAVAFEPLDRKYNAGAAAFARKADWKAYKYSAIIVLGVGPEDLATPISPRSKLNVRTAAERFLEGETAFVIVSGANVHPRGSESVEALQMRAALIERYNIPTDRIVIEPYARHTTTNLRNATRRLVALGAPLDRDMIVVSNPQHIAYVAGADFAARNKKELGYLPGIIGARLSSKEILFRPDRRSLTIDPADPLDP